MSVGLHPVCLTSTCHQANYLSVCISRVRICPSTNCRIRQPTRKMKPVVSELSDRLENRDLALEHYRLFSAKPRTMHLPLVRDMGFLFWLTACSGRSPKAPVTKGAISPKTASLAPSGPGGSVAILCIEFKGANVHDCYRACLDLNQSVVLKPCQSP
jgi:hypothetical protein